MLSDGSFFERVCGDSRDPTWSNTVVDSLRNGGRGEHTNPIKRWEHACFQRFLRFRGYHNLVQNIVSFCTKVGQASWSKFFDQLWKRSLHDFYMVEKVGQRKAEVGQDDERLLF